MLPFESTRSAADAIERVKYTHDAMIDIIIARPEISQNQIAEHFGYTVAWVSRIFCSDAFQARLAQRRTELIEPGIAASFEERLKLMANKSADILLKRLEDTDLEDAESVANGVNVAFKALELSAKSLGYGARQTNVAIQQTMTVNTLSDQQLMQIAQGVVV